MKPRWGPAMFGLAVAILIPFPSFAQINDEVYRVHGQTCGPNSKSFVQSGFRATVNGQKGLVTALHGIVGCQHASARQGELSCISDLQLTMVDVARDVAFFSSQQLATIEGSGLKGTAPPGEGQLQVVGYPWGVMTQRSHEVAYHEVPVETLDFLPPSMQVSFDKRQSPALEIKVLSLKGMIQPGYSGAPVLDEKQQVIGIANGGLAGGFAQINWAIPFSDIQWSDVQIQGGRYVSPPRLQELCAMDPRDLFAASEEPEPEAASGARIVGKIHYNNQPVSNYTKAPAVIQLMEVESRRDVPVSLDYDNQTGGFIIQGVPPGKYTPFVRLEAGYPFHVESGGDFSGRISSLNEDIVVAPGNEVISHDLKVVQVIHLKRPVDNQVCRASTNDPLETLYQSFYAPSAEVFEWDPVPGATSYAVYFDLEEGDPKNLASTKRIDLKSISTGLTRISPKLGVTGPNRFYMFMVQAYNAEKELIGNFRNYYKNGDGGWFEFRVRAGPGQEEKPPSASPEKSVPVDFPTGSKTAYVVQFSQWPAVTDEHGHVGPEGGNYVLEATSNTWMGPGRKLPISPLQGDFIMDIAFQIVRKKDCSLSITLSDAGSDYAQLSFYFDIWEAGSQTFSITEDWVRQNFYADTKRKIAERASVPPDFRSPDWTGENTLSVKREGQQIGFYLNGHLLRSFPSPDFDVRQFGLGIAFESRVLLTSVKARVRQ